jgi:predicted  nucleic acid-binding Zn-ribbon protein
LPSLSDEQIRKIVSANESLQVQLADAIAMLAFRAQEIDFLNNELAESTALRSKLDGQQDEIESIQNRLSQKQLVVKGAEEREFELQQKLTEMAILNKKYNELVQDYAYLQSQFKDTRSQLFALEERNFQLEQKAVQLGETQSRLENSLMERDALKDKISRLEAQKYL